MTERTITAYLPDGRHVDVPRSAARDWATQTADLNTTLGLADWYTNQGDENQDEIKGAVHDEARCDHLAVGDGQRRIRVMNVSQADGYDATLPHAAASVCSLRACILDGMAAIERATGENAVWVGDDDVARSVAPRSDITSASFPTYPLDEAAAKALMGENGFATFTIELDKDEFLEHVNGNWDELFITGQDLEDFVHDKVLSFGVTCDSTVDAVAIDGPLITVDYTTKVAEALKMLGED